MTHEQITYLIFGIVLIGALIFDLGLLSKKSNVVSMKKALVQTLFWVGLSLAFYFFIRWEDGKDMALDYLSAYLLEWSLSIDNIFIFILIFNAFGVKEKYYGRTLLIGILMAIVFRAIFITVGAALISRFHWILYIFGAFLLYTGVKMFTSGHDDTYNPEESRIYQFMKRFLRMTDQDDTEGRLIVWKRKKAYFTPLSLVIAMLATTDLLFALDSIPAVFLISEEPLVVYTSNIFAVLGLRSLFFLLRGAADKFDYLQQGIAVALVFIGLKMLAEIVHLKLPNYLSLIVIVVCVLTSILYSMWHKRRGSGAGNH
ncbi:TerC family protein [Compostibacter hankyongensis]|uniref:TerC family protein n=2 Tax=Compostibacter hankyongensis TaxID=1007089 RepID=A0ABP8FTL4_9BACT